MLNLSWFTRLSYMIQLQEDALRQLSCAGTNTIFGIDDTEAINVDVGFVSSDDEPEEYQPTKSGENARTTVAVSWFAYLYVTISLIYANTMPYLGYCQNWGGDRWHGGHTARQKAQGSIANPKCFKVPPRERRPSKIQFNRCPGMLRLHGMSRKSVRNWS